jgi:hypothetical protein
VTGSKRRAVGKAAAVTTVAVMVLMVAGLGTVLNEQPAASDPPSTATSTSTSMVGCEFSVHTSRAWTSAYESYTGCLTSGSSGSYLIAVDDPNGMTLSATVSAEYPSQVTVSGTQVGSLPSGGAVAYAENGTTLATPSGIVLAPNSGYSITVTNTGGQNDTVSIVLELTDNAVWTTCA